MKIPSKIIKYVDGIHTISFYFYLYPSEKDIYIIHKHLVTYKD